jgi:hypothetical protein
VKKKKLCRITWRAYQEFKKNYKGVQGRFTGLGGKFYIRYEYENSRTRVQGEIYKNVSQSSEQMYCDGCT